MEQFGEDYKCAVTGQLDGCQSRTLPILDLWGSKLLTEARRLGMVGACGMLQQDKVIFWCLRNFSLLRYSSSLISLVCVPKDARF